MRSGLLIITLFLLFAGGCAGAPSGSAASASDSLQASPREGTVLEFTGKVVYVPVEGGFFGIVADDGRKFDPRNLPEAFQRDGVPVRVTARPLEGVVGFHMWGRIVEIETIEKK